jgi:hypothetical protein
MAKQLRYDFQGINVRSQTPITPVIFPCPFQKSKRRRFPGRRAHRAQPGITHSAHTKKAFRTSNSKDFIYMPKAGLEHLDPIEDE